tara:strand:- start:1026 stop:1361 length:336 start_codon:yes stop_codon:yes gene_type:complete
MSSEIQPGTICCVKLDGLIFTSEGFAMIEGEKRKMARAYEKIDLLTFPSFNDFKGRHVIVSDGDLVMVVRKIGRPASIQNDPKWFQYDVYEVMIENSVVQMFKQNLKIIND